MEIWWWRGCGRLSEGKLPRDPGSYYVGTYTSFFITLPCQEISRGPSDIMQRGKWKSDSWLFLAIFTNYTLRSLFVDTKPHPVLPAWVWAPRPEHIPEGPAQQVLAQSAPLRHWPPINCVPFALPTFFVPEGSKAGPPFEADDAGDAATGAALVDMAATGNAPPAAGNPHPVFPACVEAPRPEQIPDGPAQHPLAQSAVLRH
jgi:hypothetical protein